MFFNVGSYYSTLILFHNFTHFGLMASTIVSDMHVINKWHMPKAQARNQKLKPIYGVGKGIFKSLA